MQLGVHFAEILREYMPWLKLISSMREPISRSMSKYIMAKDKFESGCLMNHTMVFCLRRDKEKLFGNPKNAYYSRPLKGWLDNFPQDQLLLVQYEKVRMNEMKSTHQRMQFLVDTRDIMCRLLLRTHKKKNSHVSKISSALIPP